MVAADLAGLGGGLSRYHWRLFWLCGCAWGLAGSNWFTAVQFLLPAVAGEWGLPSRGVGLYNSVCYVGMAVGAPLFGRISDLRGRRPALLGSMLLSTVAGALSALAQSWWWLAGCQFILGVGFGGAAPLPNLLFGEWCPSGCRGRYMVLLGLFFPVAAVFTTAMAWLCTQLPGAAHGWDWRLLYLLCAGLEGVWCAVLYGLLPESPRFLRVRGREEEATALIERHLGPGARAIQAQVDAMQGQGDVPRAEFTRPRQSLGPWGILHVLLGRDLRLTTLLLWVIWFGTSFGAQGFNTYVPQLLKSKSVRHDHLYQDCVVYAAAGAPGILFASLGVEASFGRRTTMSITLVLTALGIGLFAWTSQEWQLVLVMCVFNLFSNCAWCTIYAYTPEVYVTEVRSQGVGAAQMLHSFAGILAPLYGGWFVQDSATLTALVGFTIPVVIAAMAANLLPQETRDTDLQDLIN